VSEKSVEAEKVVLPAGILLTGAYVGHLFGKKSKFGALRGAVAGAILPLSTYALYKGKECSGVDCGLGNLLFAGSGFVLFGMGMGYTYGKKKVPSVILGALAGLGSISALNYAFDVAKKK